LRSLKVLLSFPIEVAPVLRALEKWQSFRRTSSGTRSLKKASRLFRSGTAPETLT